MVRKTLVCFYASQRITPGLGIETIEKITNEI